jgi:hypothetical protein
MPAPPAPPATPAPQQAAPEIESRIIPGEKIGHVPLDELLNYLKDKVPGFNAVIIRDPEVVPDYPTVPDMTLKNVTVGQLLQLLRTSFAGVEIIPIDGPTDPLYLVRIHPVEGVPTVAAAAQRAMIEQTGRLLADHLGPQPVVDLNPYGVPAATNMPLDNSPVVKVYRLNDIVQALVASQPEPANPKKAMDDVLSLIQASLDQVGGKDDVTLKVHEPTQTVVFKGSPRKMMVLEQVLDTLRPKPNEPGSVENFRKRQAELDRRMAELQDQLAAMRKKAAAAASPTQP